MMMLKRSPKPELKSFPPEVSVGVVISPPCCKEPLKWWKVHGRIWRKVPASSAYRAHRNVELRKRKNSKGNNQLRCYSVWMRDSDVNALLKSPELRSVDQAFTPREFREYREFGKAVDKARIEMVGRVIAAVAISVIKRKT